jgi:hypothetical protein
MSPTAGLMQCPEEWEYKDHPRYDSLPIKLVVRKWLSELRNSSAERRHLICLDTRPFHSELFRDLTPDSVPYFAGNYRGQPYFCLGNL